MKGRKLVLISGQALAVLYDANGGTVEGGLPCLLALAEIKHEVTNWLPERSEDCRVASNESGPREGVIRWTDGRAKTASVAA